MLEEIYALKNNKHKERTKGRIAVAGGGFILSTTQDALRTWVNRGKAKAATTAVSTGEESLQISWDDIMNTQTRGRWWLVGSAWRGTQVGDDHTDRQAGGSHPAASLASHKDMDAQDEVVSAGRDMGMNTDTRRAIFKAIMGSEDYQDAFQRLLKLGLKAQQDREVALILMDCTAQEKSYNPFYAHLAAKLCHFNRRYRFSFQLAFWDVLKDLDDCEVRKLMHLGELLGSLVAQSCLFLTQILRSTALTKLSRRGTIFFKVLFSSLLSQMSGNAMVEALFLRIAEDRENDSLRTGLSFFFQYHMKQSHAWLSSQDNQVVQERCLLAEDTLRAPSRHASRDKP